VDSHNAWDIIIPVVVALVATIPGALAYINSRRKAPAEAAESSTGAAVSSVDRLEKQVGALEVKHKELTDELDKTKAEMRRTNMELVKVQGDAELLRTEVAILRAENIRLREFAAACKSTIESLSALLKDQGFQEKPGDDMPPIPD
jgi:chromosome segregation ATPase